MNESTKAIELKVKIVSDVGSSCRLPRNITGLCSGHTVVKIPLDNVDVYISWNGGVSQSECLEIPISYINNRNLEVVKDGSYYDVVLICKVQDAVEVELVPVSSQDWDIISTQASYVENNMLKSHTVLFINQTVQVRIGSSLAANLVVKNVSLRGASPASDFIIGRITNATTLIIAPFESPKMDTHCTSESPSEPISIVWEDVNFEPHTHLQHLHVLPHSSRHRDSGFTCDIQNPHFRDVYDEVVQDLSDTYLNSFLEDSREQVVQDTLSQTSDVHSNYSSHTNTANDENTCYVHPLYFIAAYEAAIQRTLTSTEWATVHTSLTSKVWYGCVEVARRNPLHSTSSLPGLTTAPLTQHALVTVVLSVQTRPGGISLPASVRRGMNLEAYDLVRLYVINSRMGAVQVPTSITLSRVALSADTVGDTHTTDTVPESLIKTSFMRLVEANSSSTTPFILHHNQLLSLVLPRAAEEHSRESNASGSSGYESVDYVVKIATKVTTAQR